VTGEDHVDVGHVHNHAAERVRGAEVVRDNGSAAKIEVTPVGEGPR
jgi:hypothetical protein